MQCIPRCIVLCVVSFAADCTVKFMLRGSMFVKLAMRLRGLRAIKEIWAGLCVSCVVASGSQHTCWHVGF